MFGGAWQQSQLNKSPTLPSSWNHIMHIFARPQFYKGVISPIKKRLFFKKILPTTLRQPDILWEERGFAGWLSAERQEQLASRRMIPNYFWAASKERWREPKWVFFERVTKYTHLDNNRGGRGRRGVFMGH